MVTPEQLASELASERATSAGLRKELARVRDDAVRLARLLAAAQVEVDALRAKFEDAAEAEHAGRRAQLMRRLLFCGLNPSKAGWPNTDLTVTKLCGFSWRIAAPADVPVEYEIHDGGAVFSPDRFYRYRLWRVLKERGEHAASAEMIRFDIVNLSAFISTDPKGFHRAADPFGADNQKHIDAALLEADVVVAAWGSLAPCPSWLSYQRETVLRALTRLHDVQCLGKTADGSPRHPSRIAYSTPLELFRARREPTDRAAERAAKFVRDSINGGFASIEDFT